MEPASRKQAKCEHGRRRSRCKQCGGASICQHGRQRSVCKECGGSGICQQHGREAKQVAKQSNELSGCEGTVTDFKATKYIIRYKDGTTGTLTKTALMKVLTPVLVETTSAAASAAIGEEVAGGSTSGAVEASIDLYVQPDREAEQVEASAEATSLEIEQKTSEETDLTHKPPRIQKGRAQEPELTRPLTKEDPSDGAIHPAATVPNRSPNRAVSRRGIAGCWPADATFQQGSTVRFSAYGIEIVGKVLKCGSSESVKEYQIEYTWADDGKSYLEWCCSKDLEPDDPLVAVAVAVQLL
jgi:hypothetical protein